MTTITKERLQEVIDGDILFTDEQRELARIALASMDAEPVGYFYADKPGDWYQISDGDRVPDHRRISLYRHAQPASVMPDEMAISDGMNLYQKSFAQGHNACRAAMLQAGNSPVIGIDLASEPDRSVEVRYLAPPCYVMVPKEPTNEMLNAWLSEIANWRGHVAGYKAMLAAAPLQAEEPAQKK